MPFEKGKVSNPKGRQPGVPNKATTSAREAIAEFVDGNAHRLVEWLDKIAKTSPEKAFNCFMSVVEYHIPKLQRSEHDKDNAQHHIHTYELTPAQQTIVDRYLTSKEKP